MPLADAAEKRRDRAAERRLACNPLDGNAWLRYAMVETRARRRVETVTRRFARSYWTAPSELGHRIPLARSRPISFWRALSGFETEYVDDLRRFAAFESTSAASPPPMSRCRRRCAARLRPLIEGEPETRKKAILAEIDRLGVDYQRDAP